ncbi:PspC domain-containing protein [Leifsonia sp. F6_8S_P_1B]|uniref:PspC domain-containing protein n=1 Tax=Leifsonia williamsii TaxID=3035919 RepID=A0ABT8K9K4_9MICO|nr:PspC domain-containing protein [Leifsonia williamsii]MDN4613501.1 PspC domain-containing protein [Leifsonia williamsii]
MNTLERPRDGRVLAGVCAGLARRFGLTATTVRVLFVLSCLLPGPQFLVYAALWIIMPAEQVRPVATSPRA